MLEMLIEKEIATQKNFCDGVAVAKDEQKNSDDEDSKNQPVVTIQVWKSVNKGMDEYCGTRLIKRAIISKILRWFLNQPPNVKRVVLGDVDDLEAELAAALRQLAAGIEASKDDPLARRSTTRHGRVPYVAESPKDR